MPEITDKRAYDKKAIKGWVEDNPELTDNRLVVILKSNGWDDDRMYLLDLIKEIKAEMQ
ncbi:MAG: hypothetical protein WB392_15470 [Methanotrichaceae archaeon]